ncbi:DUF397 domain-containing protein [Streptomyces malaysiensis]|uniref:DUF397 domain-containing protein n=1 Tax=Streptomyces malaysiensis TaxID=92644 RepID=A0A2J7YZI3_STRMQ|nr:DUF397 domain-containing protein [Streptomyces malaysiensis]PNG93432.1 hypothetical protein SMF913_28897 [Streptomyces malaysiensis]
MPESPNWRTSSYTRSDSCVEVADNDPNKVMVRDTKARHRGIVAVQRAAWRAFVEYVKQD